MDAKEEIKQRLSVEEVVGDYLELKRSGRNLKALSPFTNEKTPSFMVSPEKQIWHDFSSNQGGDIFSFVMLMEGVDFKGAIEILARKANIDLSQFQRGNGDFSRRKKRLYELMELATKYYQHSLAKNKHALEYLLKTRRYNKEAITKFKLGYAPTGSNGLVSFLIKRGCKADELRQAGVASQRRGGIFDMFQGRIMIPLADGQGRTIGFTARILPRAGVKDSGPKYINTPQTLLYDKSRHVFGLHLAKEAIRKQDEVVIVEGNLDVVASHQAGITNVVATAGTALTSNHLLQLYRLSQNVTLAFDSDRAGVAATERAIPSTQKTGVNLKIISLKGRKDPDELIQQNPKLWQQAIQSAAQVMDWLFEHYERQYDLASGQGKTQFANKVLDALSLIEDPIEKEHYALQLAKKIDISTDVIKQKLASNDNKKPTTRYRSTRSQSIEPDASVYLDTLLALNLKYPEVRESLRGVSEGMFDEPRRKKVFNYIKSSSATARDAPKELQEIADYVKILLLRAEELYSDWAESDRLVETVGLKHRLIRENKQKLKSNLTDELRRAEAEGDDKRVQRLLRQYHDLLKEN